VKEVIIPEENLKEAQPLPSYVLQTVKLTTVKEIAEVLRVALLPPASA
jgi:ATP-dependent Lon protease